MGGGGNTTNHQYIIIIIIIMYRGEIVYLLVFLIQHIVCVNRNMTLVDVKCCPLRLAGPQP